MSKWISIEDRLPESLEDVLVSTADGNVITCANHYGSSWQDRTGEPWDSVFVSPITHWMPLPSPPEKRSE